MTENFKAAGIRILRYTYSMCKAYGIDRRQIADLFTELRDAVLIGQHGSPILPDARQAARNQRKTQLTIDIIRALHADGLSNSAIAKHLEIDDRTVAKYLALDAPIGNLHVAEPTPPVLPHSNGATARRADDQEPPKV